MSPSQLTTVDRATDLATRQRLPADTRVHQILDAALQAFVHDGYSGTRIDDIARLAGLSKGGIYTHFKSKEEIFEALLTRELSPLPLDTPPLDPAHPVDVALLVERIVDRLYGDLSDPKKGLTLQLLLSDGARVRDHVARWRHAVLLPYLSAIESLVRQGVAQGTLRDSVVQREPWLLLAPGVFAAMWQIAFDDTASAGLACQREAHIAMLRELLAPVSA